MTSRHRHNDNPVMTMTSHHQHRKYWAAALVVLIGWTFESATSHFLKPLPPVTIELYYKYWVDCIQMRNVLFIISACMLYYARGSRAIWLLMGFNLAAMLLNILYLTPSNHAILRPWRVEYFAPAYRAAELIIIVWVTWNVRDQIYTHFRYVYYCLRFVGRSRDLYKKRS